MGFVDISRQTGYKVATWVLLAVGVVFFLIAGMFALSGNRDVGPPAQGVFLTASGMVYNHPIYNFEVFKKETEVMVSVYPAGSARLTSVDVRSGGEFIEVIDKKGIKVNNTRGRGIWPGDKFYLVLIPDDSDSYGFGQEVEIYFRSGNRDVVLSVDISLPRGEVGFDFVIRDTVVRTRTYETIRAEDYLAYTGWINNSTTPVRFPLPFFIDKNLTVWGKTVDPSNVTWTATPVGISFDIDLFHENSPSGNPDGIYIPPWPLLESYWQGKTVVVRFMITATYSRQNYIEFYDLTITPPRNVA